MSQIVASAEMAKQLQEAAGPVFIVTETGAMIGQFKPFKSPISDEEFEEARKRADSGVSLSEFWKLMERGEWK